MITIWKLENDSWVLVNEFFGSLDDLKDTLNSMRLTGDIFRAEIKIESTSTILEE